MSCETGSGGVTSFNSRRGAVTLTLQDVTNALGGAPLRAPVANSSLDVMPTLTVKANLTGGSTTPSNVTISALAAALAASGGLNIVVRTLSSTSIDMTIGGLIVKAGTYPTLVNGNTNTTITFPVPFDNACIFAVGSMPNPGSSVFEDLTGIQWKSKNATQVIFYAQDGTQSTNGFDWLCLGF